jgi:hypothetical protein
MPATLQIGTALHYQNFRFEWNWSRMQWAISCLQRSDCDGDSAVYYRRAPVATLPEPIRERFVAVIRSAIRHGANPATS